MRRLSAVEYVARYRSTLLIQLLRMARVPTERVDAQERRLRTDVGLRAFGAMLLSVEEIDKEFAQLEPEQRTPEIVRGFMLKALGALIMAVNAVYFRHGVPAAPAPLGLLFAELSGVAKGQNSPFLMSRRLAEQRPPDRFSRSARNSIRNNAAVVIQLLVETGMESSQVAASERVAKILSENGFCAPGGRKTGEVINPGTVKKWHNRAKAGSAGFHMYETRLLLFSGWPNEQLVEHIEDVILPNLGRLCRKLALADA